MPRCYLCDTSYSLQSWGNPFEPCDCGMNLSREEWRTMDTSTLTAHDDVVPWSPTHCTTVERFALIEGQTIANTNGAPVGIWSRDGWYTVCETPPEMLYPDPTTQGWKLSAVIDPEDNADGAQLS